MHDRTRPELRLVQGKLTPRAQRHAVVRLEVERALRERIQRSLFEIALASALGVVVGLFWCAALATLIFQSWARWR